MAKIVLFLFETAQLNRLILCLTTTENSKLGSHKVFSVFQSFHLLATRQETQYKLMSMFLGRKHPIVLKEL